MQSENGMTATLMTARRLLADDSGATAIEYALLAALIAGVIIASVVPWARRSTACSQRQRRADRAAQWPD